MQQDHMAQRNLTKNTTVLLRNMSYMESGEGMASWSQDSQGHLDMAKGGEATGM